MIYSKNFKYDEIKVITEGESQFCIPVMAMQFELDLSIADGDSTSNAGQSSENFREAQKFPLRCAFQLPNGVYSTYLFRVCTLAENAFGVDISHFEYKGKNPASSTMNMPLENCPFDENFPVSGSHVNSGTNTQIDLKAQCVYLESLINGAINEAGMRKSGSGILANLNFHFPKYLYN